MSTARQEPQGPLAGVRVLEIGTMIAGPVAATLLADFGAEVIKIEQPGDGDPIRRIGPFAEGESLWWNVEGRNKQSITIDLHLPEGQRLVRELAAKVDVVIENFRPGTLDKWGIGYQALSQANPHLVMLSVSGFGQTGPYATRPAYDRIALAFAGFLNMTGFPDRPPVRPGTAVADYQAALYGAFSIMVALFHRDHVGSGRGQHIDLSLYESIFRFTDVMLAAYDKLGLTRERKGNDNFAAAPGDHYPTMDGKFIALTVSNNAMFARVCRAIDRPELSDDERFESHAKRYANLAEINDIVGAWISSTPRDQVLATLDREGVAYSLIYGVDDIVRDAHYQARQSFVSVPHPRLGELKMQNITPRFSACPSGPIRPAPSLGEDTDKVLADLLGMSASQIAELREIKVV